MTVPAPVHRVEVALGERSYPVCIGAGSLAGVGDALAERTGARRAVVVTEPGLGRRLGGTVLRSLRAAGLDAAKLEVPRGDASKSLRMAGRLYEGLIRAGADRDTVVVALGGGMVGDLAGFVAATFLRGLPFVQVPTSLLAMVDASVGGKVAINLPQGKNLAGAFHQPRLVWIDVAVLETLPARERAAGMAEIVKAAALFDAAFYQRLEADARRALALEPGPLLDAVARACALKAEVVARDEREGGHRMLLNLGHTVGHAIEALLRYRRLLHGEAVAIGMVHAARRSEGLGLAGPGLAARVEALLAECGLPTALLPFPRRAYLQALRVDKKRRDDRIRYVVLREIGKPDVVPLTAEEILPVGMVPRAPRRPARTGGTRRSGPRR